MHTDTATASDNAAQSGFKYAVYQHSVAYHDATRPRLGAAANAASSPLK